MENARTPLHPGLLTQEVPDHSCYCEITHSREPSGFNSAHHRSVMDYGDSSWLSDQEISGPSNTHVYRNLRPRQHVAREAVLTTREGVIISRDGLMTSRDYVVSSQRPSRYQNELRQSKKIQKGRELDLLSMRGHGRTPSVTHKGHCASCNGRCSGNVEPEEPYFTEKVTSPAAGTEALESVSEFMGTITASFIRFIFEEGSPPLRRVIWFIIWITCCGYALSNIKAAFTQYFRFETASQLSYTRVIDGELAMPAITICNMNKYRRSWLLQDGNSVVRKYEEEMIWGQELLRANNREITPEDNAAAKRLKVDMLQKDGKHGIQDMFKEVVFDERDLLSGNISEHLTEQFTELGICYTFNADGSKKVKRTGTDYGATFTININQSEYADTQESAGIKVMLHHFKEPPLIKEYGLAIPPGSEAYISTRTLKMHNLGEPFLNSNCTSRPLKTTDYYSVVGCTLECHARILDTACQCKQSHMPIDNITICTLYEHRECTEREIQRIHRGEYSARIRDCWCIDACDSTTYQYSLSRAEYPSLSAARNILSDPAVTDFSEISQLKENFIRLHVYFETLAIERVNKVCAYTTMNLLGDVGGNLGLFIGANVATLAEMLDYVTRRAVGWWGDGGLRRAGSSHGFK